MDAGEAVAFEAVRGQVAEACAAPPPVAPTCDAFEEGFGYPTAVLSVEAVSESGPEMQLGSGR